MALVGSTSSTLFHSPFSLFSPEFSHPMFVIYRSIEFLGFIHSVPALIEKGPAQRQGDERLGIIEHDEFDAEQGEGWAKGGWPEPFCRIVGQDFGKVSVRQAGQIGDFVGAEVDV